ncbi:MAG: chemotaxis protein CheW [Proteobacteria bacterium]|nr:chemotaxis protein CheW [Pseudomonadota bacterium]
MSAAAVALDERMLTFEVGSRMYALPIAGVLEVTEPKNVTSIPTLPIAVATVMNWHGDALPVVSSKCLLENEPATGRAGDPAETEHVLVLCDRPTAAARLGLPIDKVLGLVDGPPANVHGTDLVAERRSIQGRVVNVLDSKRLVARAKQVMVEATAYAAEPHGGE